MGRKVFDIQQGKYQKRVSPVSEKSVHTSSQDVVRMLPLLLGNLSSVWGAGVCLSDTSVLSTGGYVGDC